MARTFLQAIEHRHSHYALDKTEIVSTQRVKEILLSALRYVPSAFNSRSTHLVLLTGEHHNEFWKLVKDTLQKLVPPSAFPATEQKIDGSFASGYGTVLFYEDTEVVAELQKQFPTYADKFPHWAEHTSAMHQFAVWTMLQDEGLGASLQHYNPLIDVPTAEKWKIPATWRLIAQMPFGRPLSQPEPKDPGDYSSHLLVK